MMKRSLLLLALILASAGLERLSAQSQTQAAASPAVAHSAFGAKLRIAGVPNAGKISDQLYRGAQPRETGLLELKKLGITTIVDLRGEDPATIRWEQDKSKLLGIRFVSIPVSGWSPPTNEQIAKFLSLFRADPQEKIFVHCHYGEDRTGVFVAGYRMAFDNMPSEQALKEMYYFGFNAFWHPSMIAYVRDFPARLASAPTLAPFKKSE
jgi:protein tyrosine/serine phosphatase